jgi:uncharacterized protein (TIGR03083 family)
VTADRVHTASVAERLALADLLEGLDEDQWATQSLCAGWDVRTVAGHLVSALSPSPWALLRAVVRSGGRVHAANDALARRAARAPTHRIVASLRAHAGSRTAPPVTGPRGPLTDVLVHTGDIRLPLGLRHEPAADHVRPALEFVTGGRPIGFVPRGRLTGLRLVADDLGDAWGQGAVLAGAAIDLLMAACGRAAVLPRLHGPGVAVLADRLTAPQNQR